MKAIENNFEYKAEKAESYTEHWHFPLAVWFGILGIIAALVITVLGIYAALR